MINEKGGSGSCHLFFVGRYQLNFGWDGLWETDFILESRMTGILGGLHGLF